VVVEAMAMGLPVFTTHISALPEGVEDRVTGRLFPEKNPALLANAIAECWNDTETLRQWGENGQRRAREKFGLQENADALAQFIKKQSL
jgi:colanic acid/amylovoran biosynthesis glycosyltransferase